MATEKWIDSLLDEAAMSSDEEEERLPLSGTVSSASAEQTSSGDNLFSFFSPLETKEHAGSKRGSIKSLTRNVAAREEYSSKSKTTHKKIKQKVIEDRRHGLY
ncbi:hypothetical protein [Legionella donaldsonii]|uniref:hypothetical protein n=1 Tax=Legionella donaldsonii TaxID=45060 RepID=UPI00399D00BC